MNARCLLEIALARLHYGMDVSKRKRQKESVKRNLQLSSLKNKWCHFLRLGSADGISERQSKFTFGQIIWEDSNL